MDYTVKAKSKLHGIIKVAPDKSISHRAVMFASIADGITKIDNYLEGEDCIATIDCFKKLGIKIERIKHNVTVYGKGINGLSKSNEPLYVGNSGTTIRLMTGLLSAQKFDTTITGDSSIQKRPMDRIINPLTQMNASISGANNSTFAPLSIKGTTLNGITYEQKVASAQVKSAIIIASLYAKGQTQIIEPIKSRDHTEIMLNYLGANIKTVNNTIYSEPTNQLIAKNITVPNDISSAAFFIVAALICDNSSIILKDVGINPTRTGIVETLLQMGANIKYENIRELSGELVADINIKSSKLNAITIGGDIIPKMIDEIPVFAVAALFANGTTTIKNAEELKVKETNRLKAVVCELKKLGADIEETEDGMIIKGNAQLTGAEVYSYDDHRMAMSLAIAGLKSKGDTKITDCDCVNISFPNFFELLEF